ncbi:MAG TPA: beta-phosphoglucomutase [Chryseosolibacter sp.]
MINGCIFDLDGVIVDTAHYHFLAWKRLGNELGYNFTKLENEKLKGVSRMESLEILLDLAGISLNQEHKEMLADKKNAWFNDYIGQMTPNEIFPGVKDLICELKRYGLKVGLASSSKNATKVLHVLQIENEFDTVVDGTMINHTKPDPEIFLIAAKNLGLEPSTCVVIEDAEAGVEAAVAAGMKCIGIGSADLLHKANKVLRQTSDIKLATLLALGNGAC